MSEAPDTQYIIEVMRFCPELGIKFRHLKRFPAKEIHERENRNDRIRYFT